MSGSGCLVCRELRGEILLPGGLLSDDELVAAFHVPPLEQNPEPYLGHLLVVPRRHVDHLGDLWEEEAARIGVVAARAARGLRSLGGVERVYSAVVGNVADHFHLHLVPRYKGTPADVEWTRVDEWAGAPHGDAEAIGALVDRLRDAVAP